MTVHKLTAGDGYTYLTRQVASADVRRPPGQSLADYYAAKGNPPGEWLGGGAETLRVAGTPVTEAQMRALFGEGRHPDRDAMIAKGSDEPSTRLGTPYAALPHPSAGRDQRRPVAGYDLVFTPVKSASVLWGLGGDDIRAQVEAAHHEAVRSTLAWVETHAAFTRTGHAGVAQVDTTGLVAAAFDHRESRSGDPDLHTHVAIANKVCGLDGRWRSLDARLLHSVGVAASERYNTRFEDALHRRLGVQFAERPGTEPGKRPVREIVGVPLALVEHFSKRRAAIEDRYGELLAEYRREHGRDPDRSTQLKLAQQATLETREGKAPGRTLAEQVTDWTAQATAVVGEHGLDRMLEATIGRDLRTSTLDEELLDELAGMVVDTVSERRSTWTRWNAYAEAERALRPFRFPSPQAREAMTEAVLARVTSSDHSIRIEEPELVVEPAELRRASDGESVYLVHGGERYTTAGILAAEERLVAAATTRSDAVDPLMADAAIVLHEAEHDVHLDESQRQLVSYFATFNSLLALGIGPAGAGKTTAMSAYAAVLATDRRRLVPLASSAKAAQILSDELGLRAENLHKFLHENAMNSTGSTGSRDAWFRLGPRDVVLVDEAGMAGTLQLDAVVSLAASAGASVRLIGDPAQLASVDAGGALRLLESEVGAVHLDKLHRFANPHEADATLQLRGGDTTALRFYADYGRIRDGSRDAMLATAYDGWAGDVRMGYRSVLIAASGEDVRALNAKARTDRIAFGQVEPDGAQLHDGNRVGAGDWVVTRSNLRGLTCHHGRDWVKNGDTWEVTGRHDDGSLSVRHLGHRGEVQLPAAYVAEAVELAYACTAHRTQGSTLDTAHALVTGDMTRESLYVASTRGRLRNFWYVATEELLDATSDHEPDPPADARALLTGILRRSGAEQAATTTITDTNREAVSLPVLIGRYQHAREMAAVAMLRATAPKALSPALARRVLSDGVDQGPRRLALALADSVGRGADPVEILKAAAAYSDRGDDRADDLAGARSPALVLASRIADIPTTLGVPRDPPPGVPAPPLPWLRSPTVGHPGWDAYLADRAHLIVKRARGLGSLTAAYREMARLEHLPDGELGDLPPGGTTQRHAYLHAQREQHREQEREQHLAMTGASPTRPDPRPDPRPGPRRPAPARTPRPQHTRGPRLSR